MRGRVSIPKVADRTRVFEHTRIQENQMRMRRAPNVAPATFSVLQYIEHLFF